MSNIEPPRPAAQAARVPPAKRDAAPEPSTSRALWPTFMRRTLDDDQVRATVKRTAKSA